MARAILIVFNTPERGHSNGVFKKQQFLHSEKLRTVVRQKYHPEWYFLTSPAQTITLVTKDVVGLLLGEVVSTRKNTSLQRMWLDCFLEW